MSNLLPISGLSNHQDNLACLFLMFVMVFGLLPGFGIAQIAPDSLTTTATTATPGRKRHFEVAGSVGLNYIFFPTCFARIGVFPLQTKSFRISLENTGGMALVPKPDFSMVRNYYPALKLHQRIKTIWLIGGVGPEFQRITAYDVVNPQTGERETNTFNRTIDYRTDVGIKIPFNHKIEAELAIPLRWDPELPSFFTGVQTALCFRF